MRRINRCINNQLASICKQIIKLDELNEKLKQLLPGHLSPHCHVASFDKGSLSVVIRDQIWATEIRYLLPELRDKLRASGLHQLANITIKIDATVSKVVARPKKSVQLSPNVRELILQLSEKCNHDSLKKALARLAEN